MDTFHHVSRKEPCPICNHTDWCILSNDGNVAICYRVESPKLAKSGNGWIHRLRVSEVEKIGRGRQWNLSTDCGGRGATRPTATHSEDANDHCSPSPSTFTSSQPQHLNISTPPHLHISTPPHLHISTPPHLNISTSIAQYFDALPTGDVQTRMCAYLERQLGLPAPILTALDWRWDNAAHAVAIPMRNAWGEVTGIRYRALKSGAKWAKKGSKDGLFFDPDFIPFNAEELMVCEGPTDAAAAMACGFWVVGRSSCGTGRDSIRELVKQRQVKRIVIIADADEPKPRPGGGTWRPGLDGAKRLVEQLAIPYRMVLPPIGCKDLRDWYRLGTLNATTLQQAVLGSHPKIETPKWLVDELVEESKK